MNRFISVHALGFPYYNILHMTNLVINGIFERFPKLKTMWIEGGIAWVPFLMQRLDNEYMMRQSEAPLLKRLPSEYMAEQYYATQPLELTKNRKLLEATFDAINAETTALLLDRLPALGFRPAVDDLRPAVPLGRGQAQHPGRQCRQAVRAEALAARQGRQADLRRLNRRRRQSAHSVSGRYVNGIPFQRAQAAHHRGIRHHAPSGARRQARRASAASTRSRWSMPTRITTRPAASARWSTISTRPVERQKARANTNEGRRPMIPLNISYADLGGRVQRFAARKLEKTPANVHRDITLTRRSMDSDGCDLRRAVPDRCHAACDPAQARLGILR